ncbi:MAG: hypothetical protein ACLQUY_21540 [Ktedonobacterales bacterium]
MRYEVAWDGERGPAFDEDALAAAYLGLSRPKLEVIIAARTVVRQAAEAEGRDVVAAANVRFAVERTAHFVGRAEALEAIARELVGTSGHPLVVTGPSGVGNQEQTTLDCCLWYERTGNVCSRRVWLGKGESIRM